MERDVNIDSELVAARKAFEKAQEGLESARQAYEHAQLKISTRQVIIDWYKNDVVHPSENFEVYTVRELRFFGHYINRFKGYIASTSEGFFFVVYGDFDNLDYYVEMYPDNDVVDYCLKRYGCDPSSGSCNV